MTSITERRQYWLNALAEPLPLAGLTLRNRLMMSALTLQYGSDGLLSDRHLAFYRERARGHVGLLLTEQLVASPLSERTLPAVDHSPAQMREAPGRMRKREGLLE